MKMMVESVQTLILFGILHHLQPIDSITSSSLTLIPTSGCGCFGETLTYECTVMGGPGGATVWTGSALNCPSDEIVLLHRPFNGTIRSCYNGATVAQSVRVQSNLYTSQLNITFTYDIAGATITCAYDAMGDPTTINTTIQLSAQLPCLFTPTTKPSISIADYISKEFTFSWSPVASNCPAISYHILASNCGSCPTTTNHTNVTCTDVPTDGSTCKFSTQAITCGNVTGNSTSDSISVITNVSTQNGIANSSLAIITGGIMLFLAVLVVIGCLVYGIIIKRQTICSTSIKKMQVSLQSSTLNSEHLSDQQKQKEINNVQRLNSMAEYGCLDKHSTQKGNDSLLSTLPRQTSSLNKPQSSYSEDLYDKTSHRSWIVH